jgi:hypothetical protein
LCENVGIGSPSVIAADAAKTFAGIFSCLQALSARQPVKMIDKYGDVEAAEDNVGVSKNEATEANDDEERP